MSIEQARALLLAGDSARALAVLDAHRREAGEDAKLWFLRALALENLGRDADALAAYEEGLALAPDFADALHNRGLLLVRAGRLTDAETNYRRYVSACPASARAIESLIDVLLALGQYDAALDVADGHLTSVSETVGVLVRRGIALSCLRRFGEARATFALARSASESEVAALVRRVAPYADPEAVLCPENIFLERCYAALGRCDWTGWDATVAEARRIAGPELAPPSAPPPEVSAKASGIALEPAAAFMALHLPLSDAERRRLASHIAARVEAVVRPLPTLAPRRRSPMRVGILSPDFREHLNAYLLLPLFELADRTRFELYAYSLAPDDRSVARARIRNHADHFRDLSDMPRAEAVRTVRSDDLDILIDAGGHTTGSDFSITAHRPARVQALYLGFPGSLASSRIDYAIVDKVVAPSRADWTEKLIYLPATHYLYDFRTPLPNVEVLRAHYGLPNEAFVYCAFHKAEKISPAAFDLWMRILRQVPHSVLWLLALSPAAIANLRREASSRGLDPHRLILSPFDPRERYLARQRLGDLMLDAIHHSAMTTACDAMAAGLPVLTLKGSAMSSRAGESLVRAAGVPELVAPDAEDYVREAVALANDRPRLQEYRERLLRRSGPLFDTAGRVRELEAAFEQMLEG